MLEPTVSSSIERALEALRYGSVQLIVHEGQIVRIERLERIRLPAEAAAQAGLTDPVGSFHTHPGQPTAPSEGGLHERTT